MATEREAICFTQVEEISKVLHDSQWAHEWESASAVEKECQRQSVRELLKLYRLEKI